MKRNSHIANFLKKRLVHKLFLQISQNISEFVSYRKRLGECFWKNSVYIKNFFMWFYLFNC